MHSESFLCGPPDGAVVPHPLVALTEKGKDEGGTVSPAVQGWDVLKSVLCNLRCLFSVVKAGQQLIIVCLNLFLLKLTLCCYQMNPVSIPIVIFVRRLTFWIQESKILKTLKVEHKTLLCSMKINFCCLVNNATEIIF